MTRLCEHDSFERKPALLERIGKTNQGSGTQEWSHSVQKVEQKTSSQKG